MPDGALVIPARGGENFLRLAKQPENIDFMENSSGKADAVGQCGDSVEVFLKITDETIDDIMVALHGCIYTWVCPSAISELAKGRRLDDAFHIEPMKLPRCSAESPRSTYTAQDLRSIRWERP